MHSAKPLWFVASVGLGFAALGCGGGDSGAAIDAGNDAGALNLDISVCALENGPFTPEITNPYLPFTVGSEHKLEGLEGGIEPGCFWVVVPGDTAQKGGVTVRVVEKRDCEEVDAGESEPELEYFAQAPEGTVCIFGEGEDWEAGKDGYLAGLFMPGAPAVGQIFERIHGPDGVETGEITELGVLFETPAGLLNDTMTVLEDGPSVKRYARDIGEIYDDGIILVSY